MKQRTVVIAALAAVALAVGGCTSSNDEAAEDTDSATTQSDSAGDGDGSAEGTEGGNAAEGGDTDSDGGSDGGGSTSGSDSGSGGGSGSASSGGSSSSGGGSSSGGSGSSGGSNSAAGNQVPGGSTTGIDPDAVPSPATASVKWAGKTQSFLLVICQDEGSSSLATSGDDLAAGSILTMRVKGGSGQLLIESDATLEEEFYGTMKSFSYQNGKFQGSGNFEVDDETGEFTVSGDCKAL